MYKLLTSLLALCFILGSFTVAVPIQAQVDAYTEYLKNLNQYFTARRDFEGSRARYNSFKTLQAKETLTTDARDMLQTGRAALTQYTFYLAQNLDRSENINERVKREVLTDLQTHNGYLQSVANVLSDTPTFTEINTHSEALLARYGYLKTTSDQALLYLDAVRLNDQIRKLKDLIEKIDNINRTLPDTLREKSLAQTWIEEARTETSKDEEETLTIVEKSYPQPVVDPNSAPKRAFEDRSFKTSSAVLSQLTAKVINRTTKAQETLNIMIEGYQKI